MKISWVFTIRKFMQCLACVYTQRQEPMEGSKVVAMMKAESCVYETEHELVLSKPILRLLNQYSEI